MDNLITKLKSFKKEKENKNSLSSLSTTKLTQSECIQLGNRMEILINKYIELQNLYLNGFEKNQKGVKQKDVFFIDETKKIIYYAELKSNIDLDTEKAPETIKKINNIIRNDLVVRETEKFKDWTIQSYLVSLRCLTKTDIDSNLKNRYSHNITMYQADYIKEKKKWTIDLIGIRDLFDIMKVPSPTTTENNITTNYFENYDNYKILINKIVNQLKN
jgi:hypothetical protein